MQIQLHSNLRQIVSRLVASRLMQMSFAVVVCALSAGIGFRMGAPAAKQTLMADMQAAVPQPVTAQTTHTAVAWQPAAHAEQAATTPASVPLSSLVHAQNSSAGTERTASSVADAAPAMGKTQPGFHPTTTSRAPARINVPLIFRDVDPAALGFTSMQIADIDRMRTNFNEQVGQQNPADPAYRQRWVSAQFQADEQLRAFLGADKFNQYQIEAARLQ